MQFLFVIICLIPMPTLYKDCSFFTVNLVQFCETLPDPLLPQVVSSHL